MSLSNKECRLIFILHFDHSDEWDGNYICAQYFLKGSFPSLLFCILFALGDVILISCKIFDVEVFIEGRRSVS